MGEKLNEKQIAALRWADGDRPRGWSGIRYGSPPRATVNAMCKRGLMEQVGVKAMDLFQTTPAGRAALPPTETGDTQ